MLRKLRALAIAGALAISALGTIGAATAIAKSYGTCSDFQEVQRFAGYADQLGTQGILAHIDPDTGFKKCTGPGPTDPSGLGSSWVWVGLGYPGYQGGNSAIIQLGVVDCNDGLQGLCANFPNGPHFFWAAAGCNGSQPWAQDLGSGGLGDHLYKISLTSDGWYDFYIDNQQVWAVARNDPNVACWDTSSNVTDEWEGERHDYNDGLGSSVTPDTHFYDLQYKNASGWHFPSLTACGADAGSFCAVNGAHDFSIWTAL